MAVENCDGVIALFLAAVEVKEPLRSHERRVLYVYGL